MMFAIDHEADAAYLTLRIGDPTRTERHGPFTIDYDRDARPIGVEILSLRHPLDVEALIELLGSNLLTIPNAAMWLQAFARSTQAAAALSVAA